MKKPFRAQSTLEFIMIIILVLAGIVVMGPYVIRSVNAYMKSWETSSSQARHDTTTAITPWQFDPNSIIPCDFVNCDASSNNIGICNTSISSACTSTTEKARCCTYVQNFECVGGGSGSPGTCDMVGCQCTQRELAIYGGVNSTTTPPTPILPLCTHDLYPPGNPDATTSCSDKNACTGCTCDNCSAPSSCGFQPCCNQICEDTESCECSDCRKVCNDGVCNHCEKAVPITDPSFCATDCGCSVMYSDAFCQKQGAAGACNGDTMINGEYCCVRVYSSICGAGPQCLPSSSWSCRLRENAKAVCGYEPGTASCCTPCSASSNCGNVVPSSPVCH